MYLYVVRIQQPNYHWALIDTKVGLNILDF